MSYSGRPCCEPPVMVEIIPCFSEVFVALAHYAHIQRTGTPLCKVSTDAKIAVDMSANEPYGIGEFV
jgi:hypothetical protein